MSTSGKVIAIKNDLVANYKNKIASLLSLCESPIEELFLINFLGYCESKTDLDNYTVFLYDYPGTKGNSYLQNSRIRDYKAYRAENPVPWVPLGLRHIGGWEITVKPQTVITTNKATYRVDFLLEFELSNSNIIKVVIECDGHDFHEKTKEQVTKDHQRDRNLVESGYHVLRYSGSEIYNKSDFSAFKPLVMQIEEIVRLPLKIIDE